MEMRKSARAASCVLLFIWSLAACSEESPVAIPERSADQVAAGVPPRSARSRRTGRSRNRSNRGREGSYGSDLTFCHQRGPVSVPRFSSTEIRVLKWIARTPEQTAACYWRRHSSSISSLAPALHERSGVSGSG
jgi:hypothetical protein